MHRVLIVDDSKVVLKELTKDLASLGMEVVGAVRSGADAVQAAGELHPDVVLMDILMPGDMDGIDAAHAINEQFKIPVIFLSAAEDDTIIFRAGSTGAYGFLSKPAKPAALAASIEIALAKRAEETDIRETLRDVVENISDLIYVIDSKGVIKYVNRQIITIGGYTKEDVIGKSFVSFLLPGSVPKVTEIFRRQVAGEDVGPFEIEILDSSGSVHIVEIRERVLWHEGRIVEIHGIGRDVTDRKRAEQELLTARRQYQILVDNAVEGIAVIQDGVIKYANPALIKMSGYPDGGLVGLPFIEFIHPEDRATIMETHRRILAGENDPVIVMRRYLDRGGSVHIVENASMPCVWEGQPAAIVLINDVTDTYLTEQLLTIQRDVSIALSTEDRLDDALDHVLERLMTIPGVDCVGIHLVEEEGGALKTVAHRGFSDAFTSWVVGPGRNGPVAGGIRAGKSIVLNRSQIENDPGMDPFRTEKVTSQVATPVFDKAKNIGVIGIGSHTEDSVSPKVVAALEDISERLGSAIHRIRNQELLAEWEKKYRTLIENAKEGIVVIQDGLIKYVNPTGMRISGYAEGELIGRSFMELICPEDVGRVSARYDREMTGETLLDPHRYRIAWKDGTTRWVEGIGVPIEWEGRPASLSFIEDITRQKLDQDALIESEEKFRGVFETARDCMYIAAVDGTILDYNSSAKEFFGYADEEIRQLNIKDIYAYPEERERFVQEVIHKGFVENHELKLKKKDGTLIDALVTVVVRRDARGNATGLQGSVKDITLMKRLERRFVQTEKLTSLGTMISGVAHELNNPLTAIMGNAEMLSKTPGLTPDIVRRAETMLKESIRAAKIITGLLSFAREHKPERQLISVNDCIMEAYMLREYNLEVSDIRVHLSLADDISATYADPYQLQQVFINIINNARDALEKQEGGTLAIRSRQRDGWLVVEFEDNGPGIEPADLGRIFDPFFTTKDVGKGTGLGLSTAYGIINEHGGTIEAANVPGGGTIFVVSIPVMGAPASDRKAEKVSPEEEQDGKHVLVVEDEAHLRDLFLDVLSRKGFSVLTASGAQEAIELIEKGKFDAIITDIKMPGPGGIGLYRYVADRHPDLLGRIIFITGDILGEETRSFLTTTDCVYLEKPFAIDDLLKLLTTVLTR